MLLVVMAACGCSSGSDESQPAICEATVDVVDVASLRSQLRDPATAAQAADEVADRWDRVAAVAPREIAAPVGRLREYMLLLRDSGALVSNELESTMDSADRERVQALAATGVRDMRAFTDYVRRNCPGSDAVEALDDVDRGPAPIQVKSLGADAPENLAVKQRLKAAGLCVDNPVYRVEVWTSGAGGEITSLACGLGVSITSFENAADAQQVIAYRRALCSLGLPADLSFAVEGATFLDGESGPLDAAAKALGWTSAKYCP